MSDGKEALFGAAPAETPTAASRGKADLYSAASYRAKSIPTLGTVGYECGQCHESGTFGLPDAIRRILRFTLWIPGKAHNRWMECPACGQRTWLRLRWLPH